VGVAAAQQPVGDCGHPERDRHHREADQLQPHPPELLDEENRRDEADDELIASAGTIPKPSIHRHEPTSGEISRITTPTAAPSRMPTAWRLKAPTSQRPRLAEGRISAR
jgi:hypothetical protein